MAPGIDIRIDPESGVPIYRQIFDQVLVGIARGVLVPGEKLPTVRQLAVDLRVNPNTVSHAYRELEHADAIVCKRGIGTLVAENPRTREPDRERRAYLEQMCDAFVAETQRHGYALDEVIECIRGRQRKGGRKR